MKPNNTRILIGTLLVLGLVLGYAAPVYAGAGNLTVELYDEANTTGLSGGEVYYYDGGWKLLGTTVNGTVTGGVPKTTDVEIRYIGGSYKWKLVDPSTNGPLRQNTKVVTVKLETCGSAALAGDPKYYYKGWKPFGTTTTPATMELLPYTNEAGAKNSYDFHVVYDGRTSPTTTRYIADDPVVVFKTTKVDFKCGGDVWYYNHGWIPFESPKEMVGTWAHFKFGDTHNPTVQLDFDGCEMIGYPATIKLLDSNGNGLEGGYAEYRRTGWTEIGTTGSDGTVFALLPEKPWGLRLTYEWITNRLDPWDVCAEPVVTFSTIDTLVTLKTCEDVGLEGGVAEYQSGYWRPIGTTDSNGEIHKEMLPANLLFRMTYAYGTDRLRQDTGSDPSVDFTTTKVALHFSGTIEYQSGYWRDYTDPMEMMPGTYLFKFYNSGHPTAREYLTISGCEMSGTVALIKLLDSYGNGLAGGTAEWYRTSGPAGWISIPGSTDANGDLFALVGASGPNFRLTYGCTQAWEQHSLLADPTVLFQTGRVVSDSGTCEYWRSTVGGSCPVWVPFVNGVEMLPTDAREFKGYDPNYWKQYFPIVGGTENHVK